MNLRNFENALADIINELGSQLINNNDEIGHYFIRTENIAAILN